MYNIAKKCYIRLKFKRLSNLQKLMLHIILLFTQLHKITLKFAKLFLPGIHYLSICK